MLGAGGRRLVLEAHAGLIALQSGRKKEGGAKTNVCEKVCTTRIRMSKIVQWVLMLTSKYQIAMEAEVSGNGNEVKTLTQERDKHREQIALLNQQLG